MPKIPDYFRSTASWASHKKYRAAPKATLAGDARALSINRGSVPVRADGKGKEDHEVVRRIRVLSMVLRSIVAANQSIETVQSRSVK